MGLIRKTMAVGTLGAVKGSSKKQRVAKQIEKNTAMAAQAASAQAEAVTAALLAQRQAPVTPAPPALPAGWYDDGTGSQRWWDGQAWGPVAPQQDAADTQVPAAPAPPTVPAVGSDRLEVHGYMVEVGLAANVLTIRGTNGASRMAIATVPPAAGQAAPTTPDAVVLPLHMIERVTIKGATRMVNGDVRVYAPGFTREFVEFHFRRPHADGIAELSDALIAAGVLVIDGP